MTTDDDVRELVETNLRLVLKIASTFAGYGIDYDDLVGEGNRGLFHAARDFDPTRGLRFSAFAGACIRRRINDAIKSRKYRPTTRHEDSRNAVDRRTDGRDLVDAIDFIDARLPRLDDRERAIIAARFGLGTDQMTLVEIGERLGMTKERVRQIESHALAKLR